METFLAMLSNPKSKAPFFEIAQNSIYTKSRVSMKMAYELLRVKIKRGRPSSLSPKNRYKQNPIWPHFLAPTPLTNTLSSSFSKPKNSSPNPLCFGASQASFGPPSTDYQAIQVKQTFGTLLLSYFIPYSRPNCKSSTSHILIQVNVIVLISSPK